MSDFICDCGLPLDEEGYCPAGCTDVALEGQKNNDEPAESDNGEEADADWRANHPS